MLIKIRYLFITILAIILIHDATLLHAQKLKGSDKKQFKQAGQLQKDKKYEPALKLYEALRDNNTENTDILFEIGFCQKKIEKFDDAIDTYQQIIDILEEKIDILDFSTSKKDEKEQQSLVQLKRKAKNKLKSCESGNKEIIQQREEMLNDQEREKRLQENKRHETKTTGKPVSLEKNPAEKPVSNNKEIPASSGNSAFTPCKFNIKHEGEILTDYIGLQSVGAKNQIEEIKNYVADIYDDLYENDRLNKYNLSFLLTKLHKY